MNSLSLKKIIMIAIGVIGAILILLFQRGLSSPPPASSDAVIKPQEIASLVASDKPTLVSTNPATLGSGEAILWAMQPIELTFNLPLVNGPEVKQRIEPKIEYKVELSDDKKTVKLIPTQPLPLGTGFNLYLSSETKFDGDKRLDKDYNFHFRTIKYNGV